MTRTYDPEGREAEVLASLASFDDMEVLDVGCGEGRTARYIARTAASVTGVDPDEEYIATARGTNPEPGSCEIEFLCDDIMEMKLETASLDTVIFGRSL